MSPRSELTLRALWITPFVRKWLEESSQAKIHSLYRQSCNLINEHGSLISLVFPLVGPGPFAIVLEQGKGDFQQAWDMGNSVTTGTKHISLGDWKILLTEAEEWDPKPAWDSVREIRSQIGEQLPSLRLTLEQTAPVGSFAALASERLVDRGDANELQLLALRAAKEPTEQLLKGVMKADEKTVRGAAARLGGLGAGATPSGDDFLVGVMLALWAITDDDRARVLSSWMSEAARDRTNQLSKAWLAAAARGEAGFEWHQFVEALISSDREELDQVATALIQRGHTSGADAMAGFIAIAEQMAGWFN
jgi:hypothetical protein